MADVLTGQATIEDHHVLDELAEYERDAFQADAVAAVLERFKAGADRCQGYAPTGSGKTHIATAIWDGLDPPGSILVMVSPTRSVSQAAGKFREYCRATVPAARTLKVTSDPGGTTDPERIAAFLADSTAPRMVFVTDTSLPKVTETLVKLGLAADLFIIDEAHRNTAVRLADVKAFWADEAVSNVPAARRFFITATPRTTYDVLPADGRGRRIISQDNTDQFGPVAFDLPFDEAVTRGIVLPVAAYSFATSDGELAVTFNRPGIEQIWQGERMTYRELAAHLAIYKAVTAGLTPPEGTDGEPYRPERIMVSFDRVSQAKAFAKRHAAVMNALGIPDAKAFSYVGTTQEWGRQVAYRCVEDLTYGGHRLSHAVIAQCGALTEGFDLPDLDMALLASNDRSTVTIQQTIGRITRRPVRSSKRWASVVTTDVNLVEPDSELPFYSVVRALTGMSDSLRHELYEGRMANGAGGTPPVRLGTLDGKPLPEDLTERLRLALVPARRDDWIPEFIDHIREFKAQFGHVEVGGRYVAPDGYPLGSRVIGVRRDYGDKPRRGGRTARHRDDRTRLRGELALLGFRWAVQTKQKPAEWIPEFIVQLKKYATEYGGANPPVRYVAPDGYRLGQRVNQVRTHHGDAQEDIKYAVQHREAIGTLRRELDAIGFKWRKRRVASEDFITQLKMYAAEHDGSLRPPHSYVTPDGYQLGQKLRNLRSAHRRAAEGGHISRATAKTIKELDKLGFAWGIAPQPRVMTEALVTECRRRRAAGEAITNIASDVGINRATVASAISGQTWRHVPDDESGLSSNNNEIGDMT